MHLYQPLMVVEPTLSSGEPLGAGVVEEEVDRPCCWRKEIYIKDKKRSRKDQGRKRSRTEKSEEMEEQMKEVMK